MFSYPILILSSSSLVGGEFPAAMAGELRELVRATRVVDPARMKTSRREACRAVDDVED